MAATGFYYTVRDRSGMVTNHIPAVDAEGWLADLVGTSFSLHVEMDGGTPYKVAGFSYDDGVPTIYSGSAIRRLTF